MTSFPLLALAELYWHLPVMIVIISLVYSGTRYDRWGSILHEAFRWGVRMGLFLVGIVLILAGLALDDSSMAVRSVVTGAGVVLEVSLLFLK